MRRDERAEKVGRRRVDRGEYVQNTQYELLKELIKLYLNNKIPS